MGNLRFSTHKHICWRYNITHNMFYANFCFYPYIFVSIIGLPNIGLIRAIRIHSFWLPLSLHGSHCPSSSTYYFSSFPCPDAQFSPCCYNITTAAISCVYVPLRCMIISVWCCLSTIIDNYRNVMICFRLCNGVYHKSTDAIIIINFVRNYVVFIYFSCSRVSSEIGNGTQAGKKTSRKLPKMWRKTRLWWIYEISRKSRQFMIIGSFSLILL